MAWTIRDTGRGNAITLSEGFSALDGAEVKYGWLESSADYPDGTSVVMVACTHHFGKDIPNAFGRGETISIPSRPILTESFERNAEQLVVLSEVINDELIDSPQNDISAPLTVIAQFASSELDRDFERAQGDLEPLSENTIRRKGHDLRLIQSGHLRSQIRFEVNQ